MTEAEKLERESRAILEQWRHESDPEKKRLLWEGYMWRKKWHPMPIPKDPPR